MTFSITPIGTCRIANPLRRARGSSGVQVNLSRSYGYVHTSREALQQTRFMLDEVEIPNELKHLIMRPNNVSNDWSGTKHDASDLYMVEISSIKNVFVDDIPVQLNYTYRHYADFFSTSGRAREFWRQGNEVTLKERHEWLKGLQSFQRLESGDQEILSLIQSQSMPFEELEQDMTNLVDMLGREKVVFVTHVNAKRPDGEVIASRAALIKTVKEIAGLLRVPCYDPTAFMNEVGQVNAMENNGLDLTHFVPSFSDRLFQEWQDLFIKPLIGDAVEAEDTDYQERVELIRDLIKSDDIVRASNALWWERRAGNSAPELVRLMGHTKLALGDFEGAIEELEAARSVLGANEDDDIILMRCYFQLESYSKAWTLSRSLMSDETETAEIIYIGAVSSRTLGLNVESLGLWERLMHLGEYVDEAIDSLIDLSDEDDSKIYYSRIGLQAQKGHVNAFMTLWHYYLEHDHAGVTPEFLSHSGNIPNSKILGFADSAIERDKYALATKIVGHRIEQSSEISAELIDWRDEHFEKWVNGGQQAIEDRAFELAIVKIANAQRLKPIDKIGIRLHRALERNLQKEIREKLKAEAYEAVLMITGVAIENDFALRDAHLFHGRAATALNKTDSAYDALKIAANLPNATVRTHVLYARAALQNESYTEAFGEYRFISQNGDEKAASDAQRALIGLQTRAVLAVRKLIDENRHEEAWEILSEMEKTDADEERVSREKNRILLDLRKRLNAVQQDNDKLRSSIALRILQLEPMDGVSLKQAAISAMRLFKFNEAMDHWISYRSLEQNIEAVDAQIRKCRLYLSRQAAA